MSHINLDANASVPPVLSAKQALIQALDFEGNASSPHALGRAQRRVLDDARAHVAAALGGHDKEVVFTSGASEGNRWLVDAIVLLGQNRRQPLNVVCTPLEHASLAKPLLKAHERGLLKLSMLDEAVLQEADVLFTTAVHNETGIEIDLAGLMPRVPAKTIWVSDVSQAVGRKGPVPTRVDALVASAHKMGGVVGAGALLLRGNAKQLPAPWTGGGQEGGLRPGTESVPLIAAFGAAAKEVDATRKAHQALAPLRDSLEASLLAAWPFAKVLGNTDSRIPNTCAITLFDVDGEALRIAIDTAGVCVGFGSACSALAPEPSPALMALGLSPSEARSTIRISLHPKNTPEEIQEALKRLIPIGQKLNRKPY